MRCLYCGKELALLKRWTSGGEFCSDAHRQKYQEEYNKLALNRLLQAKPAESKPAAPKAANAGDEGGRSVKEAALAVIPERSTTPSREDAPVQRAPQGGVQNENPRSNPAAPHRIEPLPAAAQSSMNGNSEPVPLESEAADAGAPADPAGFLVELPLAATASAKTQATVDLALEYSAPPEFPRRSYGDVETQLFAAGPVDSVIFTHILDCAPHSGERRLEERDFLRVMPIIDVNLGAGEGSLPETVEEPMDILINPHPPQGSPALWQGMWREFEIDTDWGAFLRVAFGTTGVEDNLNGDGPKSSEVAPAENVALETAAPVPAKPEPELERKPEVEPQSEGVAMKPEVVAMKPEVVAMKTDEPRPISKPAPPPPPSPRPSFLRWGGQKQESSAPKAPPVETPKKAEPVKAESAKSEPVKSEPIKPEAAKPESLPTMVTKPLPLTLHGTAAGRGKPIQVFASAVWAGTDLHIPRSNGLPLRPVMTLGPAPAAENKVVEERRPDRTVIVKVDPKKTQPGRPDTRFANKFRKDTAIPESTESKSAAPTQTPLKAVTPIKEAAVSDKIVGDKTPGDKTTDKTARDKTVRDKPVATKAAGTTIDKTPSSELEKPREKAAPTAYDPSDLGIPSLNVDNSGGFWKRLPIAGKIGLFVTLIAMVVGVTLILKSSASSPDTGPHVVEAAPISAAESSWITDWGVEPGVRKAHDISVLRPSMNLTDYRLEFEAQIESKALGWIYRAQDEKNYYVTKLEIMKPGLEPSVAVVRYAVIKGEEKPRAQFPLNLPLRIDTLYKIRFDALGDHFTTWVQDQKVDEWTDSQLKKGGVGLYSDRGERIDLKGTLRVAPLVIKK
jgi:hypothetical protein